MSLAKQLALVFSLILVSTFAASFITSVTQMRAYLQIEALSHAQDTATSLAVALSPTFATDQGTPASSLIDAIFDRGYYQQIRLTNAEGKELVNRINPATSARVPRWFVDLLTLKPATAKQEISTEWQVSGHLEVTVHTGYAYLKLWQQSQWLLLWLGVSLLIVLLLVALILRLLLTPLRNIQKLALTISQNQFDRIQPLPWTTDIKDVALAMNTMSDKLNQTIAHLSQRLQQTSDALNSDQLTGLPLKNQFMADMKEQFMQRSHGAIFLIRLHDLGGFAKKQGNQHTDALLKNFAQRLLQLPNRFQNSRIKAYRFVGAEFVLIIPELETEEAEVFAEGLQDSLKNLSQHFNLSCFAHAGGIPFNALSNTEDLLSASFEAYQKAKIIGHNQVHFDSQPNHSMNPEAWRLYVPNVIKSADFAITLKSTTYNLKAETQNQILLAEVFSQIPDPNGKTLAIATFVSVAEMTEHIQAFDIEVVKKTLHLITEKHIQHPVAINLSVQSVCNLEFRRCLFALLQTDQTLSNNIIFSLSSYAISHDLNCLKSFIDFCHRLDCQFMLKRYESQFLPLNELSHLKLDYLRLARSYTENIAANPDKTELLENMVELAGILNFKVIAEDVKANEDFDAVKSIGLDGANL